MKKTKIVSTIGPSSDNEEILRKMILAGVDVVRINLSHSDSKEQYERIELIKRIRKELKRPVGIMIDTRGPEIRTGDMNDGKIHLEYGESVLLSSKKHAGTEKTITISCDEIGNKLKPGQEVFIDDGLIRLMVSEIIDSSNVKCIVENSGTVKSRKGVNIPNLKSELPILTEDDYTDIKFGIEQEIDFIAVSFVRNSEDVLEVRRILESGKGEEILIISKIENREGIENIDEILKVSDGIMVARGDMGVEIPAEEVPLVQKKLIKKSNEYNKPVITATQMLNSMIENPRPTRAEVNDVATAIFQGSDAIMLSGETAAGNFPVKSVETMARIASRTEEELDFEMMLEEREEIVEKSITNVISLATCKTASELDAKAIICVTSSGYTALAVSKFRPKAKIIAAAFNESVMRKLTLVWGVNSVLLEKADTTDKVIEVSVEKALDEGYIQKGDLVVITAGVPVGIHGGTNILKVHVVSEMICKTSGLGDTVTGKAYIYENEEKAKNEFEEGDILVIKSWSSELIPFMKKASAVITEEEGFTSNTFITAMNFSKTIVSGFREADCRIENNEILTVNGNRGVVYRGTAKTL